jgi:PPOX class probable F420-dependent enzyme
LTLSEVNVSRIPNSHRDLLDADVATLATIGVDGRPQLSAVWFLADGETVRVSLNTARQKTRNLHRNPACNLFILDRSNPYRYLELRGDARLEPDHDYQFAEKVDAKYGSHLRQMDGPSGQRIVVTIDPTRVNAVDLSG